MKKVISVIIVISAIVAGFSVILDKLYRKALSGMIK